MFRTPRHAPVVLTAVAVVLLAGCGSDAPSPQASSPSTVDSAAGSSTPLPSSSAPTTPSSSVAGSSSATRASSSTPSRTSTSARPSSTAPVAGVRGQVVVLNPGHNGGNASHPNEINRLVPAGYGEKKACDTTGTESNAGYPEHAFTWDVSQRVRRMLESKGVRVVMTRPNDIGVGPCVNERAAVGNRAGVDAVVSIHADGAAASGHGFHVNQASRRPDGATKKAAANSVRLGEAIHRTLVSSSGLTPSNYIGSNGYYYRSDLAGLNLATRPATFLELGNMRNAGDAALLSSKSGRARIARAVTAGILAYLAR